MTNFTRVDARREIITDIVAKLDLMSIDQVATGELAIYGENAPKHDLDDHKYVIEYTISFNDTVQADISPHPTIRTSGVISFVVGVREGGGTIVPLTIADFIHQNFRRLWLGKVRTTTPRDVGPSYGLRAWNFKRIDVPFRFDAKDFVN